MADAAVGGTGGGNWTIDVRAGACAVTEGPAAAPDLAMRYRDAESVAAGAFKTKHPMLLMVSGRMKVKGMAKMGTFAKLFPSTPSN